MRLKDFFLVEAGGTTFKDPRELGQQQQGAMQPQMGEPPKVNRLQMLPPKIAKNLQEIERACNALVQSQEEAPDLKQVVHKFLLELNKWQGEEG